MRENGKCVVFRPKIFRAGRTPGERSEVGEPVKHGPALCYEIFLRTSLPLTEYPHIVRGFCSVYKPKLRLRMSDRRFIARNSPDLASADAPLQLKVVKVAPALTPDLSLGLKNQACLNWIAIAEQVRRWQQKDRRRERSPRRTFH
jgi:hypothetical protein